MIARPRARRALWAACTVFVVSTALAGGAGAQDALNESNTAPTATPTPAEAEPDGANAELEPESRSQGQRDSSAAMEAEAEDESEEEEAKADEEDEELDEPTIPVRTIPEYDGREARGPSAAEIALWIPRILFLPIYFATEYLIRQPLRFMVSGAEERELPARVIDFFTFGPKGNVALAPSFSFDFGFRPNIGLYFRYNEFIRRELGLRAGASFGGPQWIAGAIALRIQPPTADTSFEIGVGALKRPDGLFFGLGSQVSRDVRSRYDWTSYEARGALTQQLIRNSRFRLSLGVANRTFGDDVIEGTFSVEERFNAGQIQELPPGYESGYTVINQGAQLVLDSRRARPQPGSGVRMVVDYNLGLDPNEGPARRLWITWASSLGLYLDLSGHQHVVSVTASVIAAEALSGEVPFFDLPNISGSGPMRGFVSRFLAGESGASMLLRYDWPIWMWLDGTLQLAVGNVYDGRFEGFSPGNNRLSACVGLAAVDQRDHFFEFLVGFGTETFAAGGQVQSFRFLFGGTREF